MSKEKKNNEIEINGTLIEITAKRLTFFDVQEIAPLLMNRDMDFSRYWRHALSKWLYYKPNTVDVDNLSPEDGQVLASLLPQPSQVMEWLVFREAKSDKSNISSTEEA